MSEKVISLENSQKIKNMSLLCAILVVCIHIEWPHDGSSFIGFFLYRCVSENIARIAVPFFFLVSGYFLGRHLGDLNWWPQEVKKRLKTLMVPFAIWALVDYLYVAPIFPNRPFPIWYLRCLFLFVVTGHLYKIGISRLGLLWIVLLITLSVAVDFSKGVHLCGVSVQGLLSRGYSIQGALYFSIGIMINRSTNDLTTDKRLAILCLLLWLCISGCTLYMGVELRGMEILWISSLMYCLWHVMTSYKIPVWLTSSSFPIFLMHVPLAVVWGSCLGGYSGLDRLSVAILTYILTIASSVVAASLLRRYVPRMANLLFGGR